MTRDKAYQEADMRIERARRSGASVLGIRKLKLTELPASLGKFTQLLRLELSHNKLKNLPPWLGNLTELLLLNLSDNQLAEIPKCLERLKSLEELNLSDNHLTKLPEWIGQLTQLRELNLSHNKIKKLPPSIGNLKHLELLYLSDNQLAELPKALGQLKQLQLLDLSNNQLTRLPESIGDITHLQSLNISTPGYYGINTGFVGNRLTDIPISLAQLEHLAELNLNGNPLNPELAEAYQEGLDAVKAYLRAKAEGQITLNEAKLILIGEGEVGKTCLMDALLNNPWQEHDTTHGIEIKPIRITHPDTNTEITLNSWDFGGQRVYRPTHQLFFSAPAVYLVVWKPREGPQQGFVKEWIQLVKRREPSAKVIVVATHGGPQQRQPDIDRQELWDMFGKETVVEFFYVDSKPGENGNRKGIGELKLAIARIAATLPEMGRSVPKSFADVRAALQATGVPYLPLDEVLAICRAYNMDNEIARLFITISHRLGHLTYYAHDPTLRDIVILRPDWLATALSYVLDDEQTRAAHGLVKFSRLGQLWDDKTRGADSRYPAALHPIFLRLMERFDLSYRVADPAVQDNSDPLSLIGQLVPDIRPENIESAWPSVPSAGDLQQTQICRIVDKQTGQSATAEGLFYQLIVRLHKYSLGRVDYKDSVHWRHGLVLDDDYNGRGLLEHVGNDVRITVRAPYPQGFLTMLTAEVKYLIESFWEGLRCNVMVPCVEPCGLDKPGSGLYDVKSLIESKREGFPKFPCPTCNKWQDIDKLLTNAPAAQPDITSLIFAEFAEVKVELTKARQQILYLGEKTMGRFDTLDDRTRRTLSRVDKIYTDFLQVLTDEAKEGPRLFSLVPINRSNFNPREWMRAKFRLTLWCEHSCLPLPALNGKDSKEGVYEIELEREWFKKASPYLKLVTGTLSLVLPVASSAIKLSLDEISYKAIEEQLDFGKSVIDATIVETTKVGEFFGAADTTDLEFGASIHAHGATLRELHALLKAKDPGFGGLVRVMNKRQEFLWVHERFSSEY